jgi:hypothetical protein
MTRAAGYSGTPLTDKLGIKNAYRVSFVNEPPGYRALLGHLPKDVKVLGPAARDLDLVHLFAKETAQCLAALPRAKARIKSSGAVWVSWPKRSSPLHKDLDENGVREIGLSHGLVDVKVAAIDDDWSGLKLVYRLKDRR